jgi:hypothetical protein
MNKKCNDCIDVKCSTRKHSNLKKDFAMKQRKELARDIAQSSR